MAKVKDIAEALVGDVLKSAEFEGEGRWRLNFQAGAWLNLETPWRLLADGRPVFGGCDHGQWFGHDKPIDGTLRLQETLAGRPITLVNLCQKTGDLTVEFEGDRKIQTFNESSGYESWLLQTAAGQIVAVGGGEVHFVNDVAPGHEIGIHEDERDI